MTAGEMKEWLNAWDDDEEVFFCAVNVEKRIKWGTDESCEVIALTDGAVPALFLSLKNDGEPFDEQETRAAEACEEAAMKEEKNG